MHAYMHPFTRSSAHPSIGGPCIHPFMHPLIGHARWKSSSCKVERQLMQGGKAACARSKSSMCKGEGHHLLAQGNLFKQGFGAWGQVGLSQALGRLGVWAQQFCLEILTLYPHGVKSADTHGTIPTFTWACLPCRLLLNKLHLLSIYVDLQQSEGSLLRSRSSAGMLCNIEAICNALLASVIVKQAGKDDPTA